MDEDYASRHRAGAAELQEFLHRLGEELANDDVRVTGYLIGGGAMTIRGLKDGTKDIDMIVETARERKALRAVAMRLGYETQQIDPFTKIVPKEYEGFRGDLHRKDKHVGLDVFERVVMSQFELTESMKARAQAESENHGNLDVYLCVNEDILLLKSITRRPDDDLDVLLLIGTHPDREVMRRALKDQPPRSGAPWPEYVVEQLGLIEQRTGARIPVEGGVIWLSGA